ASSIDRNWPGNVNSREDEADAQLFRDRYALDPDHPPLTIETLRGSGPRVALGMRTLTRPDRRRCGPSDPCRETALHDSTCFCARAWAVAWSSAFAESQPENQAALRRVAALISGLFLPVGTMGRS